MLVPGASAPTAPPIVNGSVSPPRSSSSPAQARPVVVRVGVAAGILDLAQRRVVAVRASVSSSSIASCATALAFATRVRLGRSSDTPTDTLPIAASPLTSRATTSTNPRSNKSSRFSPGWVSKFASSSTVDADRARAVCGDRSGETNVNSMTGPRSSEPVRTVPFCDRTHCRLGCSPANEPKAKDVSASEPAVKLSALATTAAFGADPFGRFASSTTRVAKSPPVGSTSTSSRYFGCPRQAVRRPISGHPVSKLLLAEKIERIIARERVDRRIAEVSAGRGCAVRTIRTVAGRPQHRLIGCDRVRGFELSAVKRAPVDVERDVAARRTHSNRRTGRSSVSSGCRTE